jgi:Ca-activated chloride channel homolog
MIAAPFRLLCFLFFALLAIFAPSAFAQTPGAQDVGAPTLRWHGNDGVVREAVALDLDVAYAVSGLVAEATVRQTFRNDSAQFVEGQYLLPLPEGAAVHTLRMRIGERVIEGEIREREQARAEYQAAAAAGQRTSLVEQHQANIFRTAVANVAPGETVLVEIGYWQRVRFHDGRFELVFPLTFVPRYSQTAGRDAIDSTPPALTDTSNIVAAPRVDLAIALEPGLPLRSIESASHPITVERRGSAYSVALNGDRVPADRDFVLSWHPEPQASPTAALFVEHGEDADYALVMTMAPDAGKSVRLPRELILVIDTSGSMLGTSMDQAKAAADLALARLEPQDRFNVIDFDSTTSFLFEAPVPATAESVAQARTYVSMLYADGGTEMTPALKLALSGEAPPGFVRQVVFATDGAVTDAEGLYTLIDAELGDARLFPVGIGDAPNANFLEQAARMGRGASVVVRDLASVAERMQELYDKLDKPVLRDLTLAWPDSSNAFPQRLPDLYQGEPLIAVAKLAPGAKRVEAHGLLKDKPWSKSLTLARERNDRGIARLWARAKIDDIEDRQRRGLPEDEARLQIIDVALANHLVTRYTSLVAVDKTPVRGPTEPLNGETVDSEDTMSFAQGATPAPLLLALGLLGVLMLVLSRALPTPARSMGVSR